MEEIKETNREYKDRLFKAVFGRETEQSKKWRLELYNALTGRKHSSTEDMTLTTIENVLYITMKNDVSLLVDSQMVLWEQQSTYNPNMPLRGLMYFAQLYQKELSKRGANLYGSNLIRIPEPRFYVFYNGVREIADKVKLKLSDAFENRVPGKKGNGEFEWTATMLNINSGHNKALNKKCKSLYDYSSYIGKIRENLSEGCTLRLAVERAIDFAISKNMLNGFFRDQKMEVLNMSLTEFDQVSYENQIRAEGRAEGRVEGRADTVRLFLANGMSEEVIAETLKMSIDDLHALLAAYSC